MLYDVTTSDNKYRYTMDEEGKIKTYRHGEPWPVRDESALGDKFLLTLVQDLANAREQIATFVALGSAPTPAVINACFDATDDQLENTFTDESEGDTWERTLAAQIHTLRYARYEVVGYQVRGVQHHGDNSKGWDLFSILPDWVSETDQHGNPRWDVRPVYALRSKD